MIGPAAPGFEKPVLDRFSRVSLPLRGRGGLSDSGLHIPSPCKEGGWQGRAGVALAGLCYA